jgi:hypothetical protein
MFPEKINIFRKKKLKRKIPVSDIVFSKKRKDVVLRKNDLKIQIDLNDVKNKIKSNKYILIFASLFIAFILGKLIISTKAETAVFYPTSCLGGWQNASKAEGPPDLNTDTEPEKFNKNNSAYLKNSLSQIYCGNFNGEALDKNFKIKRAYLTFSWLVLSEKEEQSLISGSSFVQEVNTENSSTIQIINPISNSVSNPKEETLKESQTQTSTDNSAKVQTETQIQTSTQNPKTQTSTEIQTPSPIDNQSQNSTQTPSESSTTSEGSESQLPNPENQPYKEPETQTPQIEKTETQNPTPNPENPPTINFLPKLLFAKAFAQNNLTSTEEVQEQSTANQNTLNSSNTTSTLNNESANNSNQTSSENTSTKEGASTNSENLNQDNNQIQIPDGAFLEVLYTLDGETWNHLGFVTKTNWKTWEPEIPDINTDNLPNLQISLKSIASDFAPVIYLDGMTLNIEYEKEISNEEVTNQDQEEQLNQEELNQESEKQPEETKPEEIKFEITPLKPYFYNDEKPEFILNNAKNESIWEKLKTLFGNKIEISDLVLLNPEGKEINFNFEVKEENNDYKISINNPQEWKDGSWKLKAQVNRFDKIYNSEVSFDWKKRPEKKVVFNLNGQLAVSEKYLEWHQEFNKIKNNVKNAGGGFRLNSDRTKLIFEGNCQKEYFVILGYRHLNDYKTNPTSFIYNKAFNCKNGYYYYELNDLPLNITPQTYYFLVAEQNASGSWYPISAISPVAISIEER